MSFLGILNCPDIAGTVKGLPQAM